MNLKKLGKAILCRVLEAQVKQLRRKYNFTIVAVSGSVGKTSTKLAIAQGLSGSRRVLYQEGNYNDRLTVPLVLFEHDEPGIYNILAWLRILLSNRSKLGRPYPYDIVVLELGTDGPGQMAKFAYLKPELSVVTSIAAEHMVFFGSLAKVAQEELEPLNFSVKTLLNLDDIPAEFLPDKGYLSYGSSAKADYQLTSRSAKELAGQQLVYQLPNAQKVELAVKLLGKQGAKSCLAALAVGDILGLPVESIADNLANLTPAAGRMNILSGQNNSIIIDDTYNASPVAVQAALDVLKTVAAPQRIAILGSMNELGAGSAAAHKKIGEACDPGLSLVVTIGQAASEQLAPAAQARGCEVNSFLSPVEAGNYVKSLLKPGTVVLAKGSQNGVFAEEAVKCLLADPADSKKLVRQTDHWIKQKRRQFAGI